MMLTVLKLIRSCLSEELIRTWKTLQVIHTKSNVADFLSGLDYGSKRIPWTCNWRVQNVVHVGQCGGSDCFSVSMRVHLKNQFLHRLLEFNGMRKNMKNSGQACAPDHIRRSQWEGLSDHFQGPDIKGSSSLCRGEEDEEGVGPLTSLICSDNISLPQLLFRSILVYFMLMLT